MTDESATGGAAANDTCVFCDVIAGGGGASILYEDELVLAVDVPPGPNKRGPVHFVVVPRCHVRDALALTEDEAPLIARLFTTATALARQAGIAESGFRLLSNTGPDGNQTVAHLHLHCIGGRRLGPEAVWDGDEAAQ